MDWSWIRAWWHRAEQQPQLHRPEAGAGDHAASDRAPELLDHLEEGVLLVDHGIVRWLNRTAVRAFAGVENPVGRSLLEVVRDHRIDALVARAITTGLEEAVEIEVPVSRRVLYIRAVPLAAGGIVVLTNDVTRLRFLETVRQQFVANLSHDMRTPLAGLELAAQTLADVLPAEGDARVFLNRVIQESLRLEAIVTNLGQLAALDEQGIPVDHREFDVPLLVRALIERNQPTAVERGLQLLSELPAEQLVAWGDPLKTDQALQNVVDNALKFTRQGRVLVAARASEARVEITVRDTGPGIPARELPRIFERFYKVDRARGGQPGSGLGLTIARHLIELQGGTAGAESTPGEGTEVRFSLPRPPLTSP